MTKVYFRHNYYTCKLINEICMQDQFDGPRGEDGRELPPNCDECVAYAAWKKSGMTIEEVRERGLEY